MPVYVYVCKAHKEPLQAYIERSIHTVEEIPTCVQCGKRMERRFDAPPVTFMGKGWGKD